MTGGSGNKLSVCPLRFRIASPKISIDLDCASFNINSWGGDPESLGANISADYPQDQSLIVYHLLCYNFNSCEAYSHIKRGKPVNQCYTIYSTRIILCYSQITILSTLLQL